MKVCWVGEGCGWVGEAVGVWTRVFLFRKLASWRSYMSSPPMRYITATTQSNYC